MNETTWRFWFDDGVAMDVYGGGMHEARIRTLNARMVDGSDTEIVKVAASENCGAFRRIKNERI